MDHELLHSDRGDYDLRLNNKVKKDKDKTDAGERKKWNFRKTSGSEASGNDVPSSTFGLINQSSEGRSKRNVSPTMIFENALSDHDEQNDTVQVKSPPGSLSISQSPAQQTRISPKTPGKEQQGTQITRARQRSLPLNTSPPPMINRPHSVRKPVRQTSVPTRQKPATLLQQQSLSSPPPPQERADFTKTTSDLPADSQWQSVQQSYFTQDSLTHVIEKSQENHSSKARAFSDKGTTAVESVDDNQATMWQENQEISHGDWTDFLSPSNEVFVPDDSAWAGTENIVVDDDEDGGAVNSGNISHSSQSNSSESDNEVTEESVWRINEEQRAYYLNQFRILQPIENGVVAGQKARDFFLKSGLGTDVLSKIWNLADMDNDGALNFEEFCIAMHVVVAVRHGLEVPDVLPQYLMPEKYEKQAHKMETSSNELSLRDSSQSWARFSPHPHDQLNENDGQTAQTGGTAVQAGTKDVQTHGQHVHTHNQQINQHVPQTSLQTQQLRQHTQPGGEITQHNQQVSQHLQSVTQHEQPATQPGQQIQQPQQASQRQAITQPAGSLKRTMSDPSSADESISKDNSTHTPRKISVGIPRVRGQPKQTNLLDTPHWAILPPPSKFNKENPEETSKGNQFVPTGTIIPADPEDHSKHVNFEKPDQVLSRDSDSSSSETELPDNKERPKSLSHEIEDSGESSLSKNSSDNSLGVGQDSVDGGKKISAPVPPPRRRSGHSRSSSLDLQKLFNKGGTAATFQNTTDNAKESTRNTQENFANFDDFNKFENTSASQSNENIPRFGHRRSASLDSTHAVFVEQPCQPVIAESIEDKDGKDVSSIRPDVSASVPRPVPKKKPASPPPPLLSKQKKEGQQDSGSENMIEKDKKSSKEPIHFVVKPLTRLEQLHAKIRDLKTKNTRLSRINNELQQEFKEMMEKRIGLESSLEQLKPFAK